jgi:hypothetical protein
VLFNDGLLLLLLMRFRRTSWPFFVWGWGSQRQKRKSGSCRGRKGKSNFSALPLGLAGLVVVCLCPGRHGKKPPREALANVHRHRRAASMLLWVAIVGGVISFILVRLPPPHAPPTEK